MTTVNKASGYVQVPASGAIRIESGRIFCCQATEDYIPPSGNNLVAWLDVGDTTTTSTRAGGLQMPSRPADAALWGLTGATATTLSVDGGSTFAVSRQNDRPVVHFGSGSSGITGTWGPLASSGSWTVMMYVKLDQPVDDYGTTYTGLGRPILLMVSAPLGLSIPLPTQGAVPSAAIYDGTNDSPIDGVLPGAPWDVVFVDHWRQLCIVNDAASGVRTTYVDGWMVTTSAASSFSVPANTSVVLSGGCPMALAEWLVWDGVPLTPTDIRQTCRAQRTKWNVPMQLMPPSISASSAQTTFLALPGALRQLQQPPTPDVWLDATRGVCRDAAGTHRASAHGRVLRWNDSGTDSNHCSFASSCKAAYGLGPLDRIHAKLPVVLIPSGPGRFTYDPLSGTGTTGFTVIAVWRTVGDAEGGGGHPLSGSFPTSVFGEAGWREWIGTDDCGILQSPGRA
jgi:hypothetical protein